MPERWIPVVPDVGEPNPGSAGCQRAKPRWCRSAGSRRCQMSERRTPLLLESQTPAVPDTGEPNPVHAGAPDPGGARCRKPNPDGAGAPDPGSSRHQRAKPRWCWSTKSWWCQMSELQTPMVPERWILAVPDVGAPNPGSAGAPDPGAAGYRRAKPRQPPQSQSVGEQITRGAAFFLPARIPG